MRFVVNLVSAGATNIYSRQKQISQSVFQYLPKYYTRDSLQKRVCLLRQ